MKNKGSFFIYCIFYFTFIIIFLTFRSAFADLKVEEWRQRNTFTKFGQEVEIKVKLKAVNLKPNYYHDYWGYIFDDNSRINVLEARVVNSHKYKSTFGDNTLKIQFDKLYNNRTVTLYFKYEVLNKEIDNIKYIRREWVQIPKFAGGAKGELIVKTLENMDVYSTHDIFKNTYDAYYWIGIISKNGIAELFQMTLKEAEWRVSTVVDIKNTAGSLNNLKVVVPLNFIGGNNDIINYNISNNQINYIDNKIIKKNKEDAEVRFLKYHQNNGFVKIDARIRNNYNNFYWLNDFDIQDTLKINQNYVSDYNSLINKIESEDGTNLPTHVKIAKWVNKNIKYNLHYVGRKMTSKEILNLGQGVCEHYSVLYQDLLRSIGIPAKTISGISYDFDKQKFENHAWVMVNYNSQWLPIDPTWGIYSGKLPISHIFLYNDIRNPVKYSMYDSLDGVSVSIVNGAEFVGGM